MAQLAEQLRTSAELGNCWRGKSLVLDLVEEAARRVGRASPAFIKELMRRAAQAMLERGAEGEIDKSDLEQALQDMLGASGRLGARIVGVEDGFGFSAPS